MHACTMLNACMHIKLNACMHNFKSVNQPIDVQLVGIAEATKARKEKRKRRKSSGGSDDF
jgi:hypothetical protein